MAGNNRKKDLSLLQKMYIPEIMKGLALTFKNMLRKPVTMEYPEVKFVPPASYQIGRASCRERV